MAKKLSEEEQTRQNALMEAALDLEIRIDEEQRKTRGDMSPPRAVPRSMFPDMPVRENYPDPGSYDKALQHWNNHARRLLALTRAAQRCDQT